MQFTKEELKGAHKSKNQLLRKAYRTWHNVKNRCRTKSAEMYKKYGSRGITYCHRWENFPAFLDDMGLPPSMKHSIDRINNDGNYEPSNCRWATTCTQSRNKRTSRLIEVDGITRTLAEWMEHYEIKFGITYDRLSRGWPPKLAFETPPLTVYKRSKGSRAWMSA